MDEEEKGSPSNEYDKGREDEREDDGIYDREDAVLYDAEENKEEVSSAHEGKSSPLESLESSEGNNEDGDRTVVKDIGGDGGAENYID